MKFLKKIRDFLQGAPANEVITDTALDVPKDYVQEAPDPRTQLPADHIDYIEPENITETADRLRIPPPSKL